MKRIFIIFMAIILFVLSSCTDPSNEPIKLPEKGSIEQGDIMLFPKSEYGYIGDPMPFYRDGIMNMFYLLDERRGSIGFHPFALLQTTNFLEWEDIGTVIPYVNSISSQDLALGTGSVVQDAEGLYHAFYTGHNGTGEMTFFERIQHATSTDMITWEKHPESGFYGGSNDFRDPYIYFDEISQEYWMIITTRDYLGGVLVRYSSTNLWNWKNEGIFYRNTEGGYNMECPTLIYFNGYYYLSFNEQGSGNDRVFHYRYTTNIADGFTIPPRDSFDGWGFYAGRIEKMEDRLILSGWVATKTLSIDLGTYIWGGNLVNHELIQKPNGQLGIKLLSEIDEKLNHEVNYELFDTNADIDVNSYIFDEFSGYNYVLFESLLERATKINFTVDIQQSSNFGITLNAYESVIGDLNIWMDFENNKLEFYNIDANKLTNSDPEISIDFDFSSYDELECQLITEGSILVLYINGEIALTSRAYNMASSEFGFFTLQSKAIVKDIHFYE